MFVRCWPFCLGLNAFSSKGVEIDVRQIWEIDVHDIHKALLLTWFNSNPIMDNQSPASSVLGEITYPFPKLDESTVRRHLKSPWSLSGRSLHISFKLMAKVRLGWSLRPSVHSVCVHFILWQPNHLWLRYSKFQIWPWKFIVKVMARVKYDGHIWGLEFNRYVCFLFRGNRTIFGPDIANVISDLENSRSRLEWVGLWGFLWWAPSAKRKDHHGVSSGLSSVWHRSNTGLSSTHYEQTQLYLGFGHFGWLSSFFRSKTFWRAYG